MFWRYHKCRLKHLSTKESLPLKALATGLGTLGRYGDEYMVHAAHGETVVPAEILEANPELKQSIIPTNAFDGY